jgi:Xaa-Pro aminopeptidase
MWLILCQEDTPDPVHATMIPMDTWCPILQVLVFYDPGAGASVERINISGTDTHDLFDRPYKGQVEGEQWALVRKIIEERKPRRIGINTGSIQWAAGGLTQNLYSQLVRNLPPGSVDRLVSAEPAAVRWLSTLTGGEIEVFEHVVAVAHSIIADCYSRRAILPGVTTTTDLVWHYWQRAADLGLELAFRPFFKLIRSDTARTRFGEADMVIRPGDVVHCDVGIKYLRLNSDHQHLVYIQRPGEESAPAGMQRLYAQAVRLQDIFMAEFRRGLTGNQLLTNILARARAEGVPGPRIYSHSLGLLLHEPGPLIGLPWEQVSCAGRGDVPLEDGSAFTMELSVEGPVPEWNGDVRLPLEEDVVFTGGVCRPVHCRQTEFLLL